MKNENLSPEHLAENDLLCEKLLGLIPYRPRGQCGWWWQVPIEAKYLIRYQRLTFTTWAEAGMLLDAMMHAWPASRAELRNLGGSLVIGNLSTIEIREAALEYIKTVKS